MVWISMQFNLHNNKNMILSTLTIYEKIQALINFYPDEEPGAGGLES